MVVVGALYDCTTAVLPDRTVVMIIFFLPNTHIMVVTATNNDILSSLFSILFPSHPRLEVKQWRLGV
jgi:hypothetical protein